MNIEANDLYFSIVVIIQLSYLILMLAVIIIKT